MYVGRLRLSSELQFDLHIAKVEVEEEEEINKKTNLNTKLWFVRELGRKPKV